MNQVRVQILLEPRQHTALKKAARRANKSMSELVREITDEYLSKNEPDQDDEMLAALNNLKRILRPKGLIYISDYVLQDDERNEERYQRYEEEFGIYGVFRLPEGTVVRHHSTAWIETLTSSFETLDLVYPEVVTMNGHRAKAFQYLGRTF